MADRKRKRRPRKKKIRAKLKGKVYVGDEVERMRQELKKSLEKSMEQQIKIDSLKHENDSLKQVIKVRLK